MKICDKCNEEKDELEDFTKNVSKKGGIHPTCKLCKREQQKAWYKKAAPIHKKNVLKRNKEILEKHRKLLYDYLLKNPCVHCGETDPVILEFDHLRDKTKPVSNMLASAYRWERILEEISKCQVLCANCHRRKTAKDQNWYSHKRSLNAP